MNKAVRSGTSSQYKGVTATKYGTWSAQVVFEGKRYHLGTYKSEVEAAMAYNQFILEKCPEHGWLNPIEVKPDDEPTKSPKRRKYRGTPIKHKPKALIPVQSQKPSPPDWSALHPKPPEGMSLIDFLSQPTDPERLAAIVAKGAERRAAEEAKRAERKRRIEARKSIEPHWHD